MAGIGLPGDGLSRNGWAGDGLAGDGCVENCVLARRANVRSTGAAAAA